METHEEASTPKQSLVVRLLLFLMRPKVGIPLAIILVLLSAPIVFHSYRVNQLPDIGDPFDVDAFGTVDISDAENAFTEYKAASSLLIEFKGSPGSNDEYAKALEEGWPGASEDIRKWMETNRAAMELWRQGTEKTKSLYHQPREVHIATLLPVSQNMREFARLATLEGSRLEEAGQWDEAWDWYRAMSRSSRHSGQHGTMIERLVGGAIHGMAAESIQKWAHNPEVTANQIQQAMQELQSDFMLTPPTSESLKVEYLVLQKIFALGGIDEYVLDDLSVPEAIRSPALYCLGEPELSRRIVQHVWKNQLAHVDAPLHKQPTRTPGNLQLFETPSTAAPATEEEITAAFHSSFLARFLLPATMQFDIACRREQLRHRALMVVLAAQWYKRDHGEFPEKIEDLLKTYLDEILIDPHDRKGGTLQYRRNAEGFTVWGLGENGVDDGGQIGWDSDHDDFGFEVGKTQEKPETE